MRGFPQIRRNFFGGVPIMRIVAFRGLNWVPRIQGNNYVNPLEKAIVHRGPLRFHATLGWMTRRG